MDSEDLVASALEPGERIVWSDRPHGVAGAWSSFSDARRRSKLELLVFTLAYGLVCGPVPIVALLGVTSLMEKARGGWTVAASDVVAAAVPLAITLPYVAFLAYTLSRLVSVRADRYAVTDRGRALVASRGTLAISSLPTADAITSDAHGGQEFGDVVVGKSGPVFYGVSYPLIAIESIRSVAAKPLTSG